MLCESCLRAVLVMRAEVLPSMCDVVVNSVIQCRLCLVLWVRKKVCRVGASDVMKWLRALTGPDTWTSCWRRVRAVLIGFVGGSDVPLGPAICFGSRLPNWWGW